MPLSTEMLRERLAGQHWTAHNIRLTSELMTLPNQPDFMDTDLRLRAILRILGLLYRTGLVKLRIADLGCLEGGFTLALAQRGASVIGVEARAANLDKARLLKDHFGLPNLEFLLGDVKDFTREGFGEFDVVLALGILYHLDDPLAWLRQVAEATRGVLLVDSHYAPADEAGLACLDPRLSALGPLEQLELGGAVYEGRWFRERPDGADPEPDPWASYSNSSSFWLTKESLLLGLLRSGFDVTLEQPDLTAERYQFHATTFSRAMFAAIKTAAFQ